jgi:hypothetical protein
MFQRMNFSSNVEKPKFANLARALCENEMVKSIGVSPISLIILNRYNIKILLWALFFAATQFKNYGKYTNFIK